MCLETLRTALVYTFSSIRYTYILAHLMKKYKQIQDFNQGQKFLFDPGVLTMRSTYSFSTLVVMEVK